MSLHTCHACGKKRIAGKKALVLGTMRTVCLDCAGKALRVCVMVTNAKCCDPHCNETANTCEKHARAAVVAALKEPLGPIVAALRAMIRGLGVVKTPDLGAVEHVQGKIEGLESALALCEGALKP